MPDSFLSEYAVGVLGWQARIPCTKKYSYQKEGFTMVSKTKRALALVLTAMISASAMAGCAQGNGGSTTTTSTPAASTPAADGDNSTVASQASFIDLTSEGTQATIKGKIKSEAEATGGKIELEVWCSSDDKAFETSRIKEFKKAYETDGVSITVKVSAVGEDKVGGKVLEKPDEAADVFNFADDQLTGLVESKAIAELGDLFQGNIIKNNTEDSVAVCSVNGTPYAFPRTSDNGYFMYYDKRVFSEDEVGDMDAMIQKAAAQNKNVYYPLGNAWYNAGFFFATGCTISYDAKTKQQTTTYNSPEALKAAKAMNHLAVNLHKGFEGSAGSLGDNVFVAQGFTDGTLAAAVIGTWAGPDIKKAIGEENVGAAKLPVADMDGEKVQIHSFGGYKVVGVNKFTKYPITSKMLAYFLTDKDSQLARYNERGLVPTNNEALQDSKVQSDPALKAINDQKPYSHPQGASVGTSFWSCKPNVIGDKIVESAGTLSEADMKEILASIQSQIDASNKANAS